MSAIARPVKGRQKWRRREGGREGETKRRPTAECFALLFGDVAKNDEFRLIPTWVRRNSSGGDVFCACRDGTIALRQA